MAYTDLPRALATWLMMFAPPHVYQGTWATAYLSTVGGSYVANSSPAVNDAAGFNIDITEGAWTLAAWLGTSLASGIATFDISYDGGSTWTTLGTLDCYAAAGTKQFVATGIAVAVGITTAILRVKMASKNASSAGYACVFAQLGILRTA